MLDSNLCASAGRRAAGALVDFVVVGFLVFVSSLVVGALFPDDGLDPYTTSEQLGGLFVLAGIVLLPVVYGAVQMRWGGSTLGQRFTGTRTVSVTTPDGLTTIAAVQRAIVWCAGGWCLGFSLFSANRQRWHQAWHDRLADTVVVYAADHDAVVETVRAALADGIEVLPRERAAPEPVAAPAPVPASAAAPPSEPGPAPEPVSFGPAAPPAEATVPLLEAHQWLVAAAALRATGDDHPDSIAWQAMAITLAAPEPGLRWCNELAVSHPQNAGVHAARALYQLRDDERDHAERSLAQARSAGSTDLVRLAEAVFTAVDGTDERDEHRRAYLDRGGDPFLLAFFTASVCLMTGSVRGREPALEAVRLAPDDPHANALAVHIATATPGPELAREQIYAWAERTVALAPNTRLAGHAVASALGSRKLRWARPPETLRAWNDVYTLSRDQPVVPPPGSVLEQPGRCACDQLRDLRGDLGIAYVQQHLVVVGRVDGLASVEAECPDTHVRWLGLESSEPESMGSAMVVKVPTLAVPEEVGTRREMHGGYL